jgi:hypothetical protein
VNYCRITYFILFDIDFVVAENWNIYAGNPAYLLLELRFLDCA